MGDRTDNLPGLASPAIPGSGVALDRVREDLNAAASPDTSLADVQDSLRQRARLLLQDGSIGHLIGWEAGRFANQTTPTVVREAAQADRLVYNRYCAQLLAKYPREYPNPKKKIGVVVRGCDSRGINLALQNGQLKSADLYLIGVPCYGRKNARTDAELAVCRTCAQRNPLDCDEFIGSPVAELGEVEQAERFCEVELIEALSYAERYDYWADVFSRCVRCKACRDACPVCTCKQCFTDQAATGWQSKETSLVENQSYGITRMFHAGERCIECGECERVCPMRLPLMQMNRKILKDAQEIFGSYVAGSDSVTPGPLDTYLVDDVEEFM